ncbi:class I SAM-dependent methyltransferase [Bacillus sp. AFS017336]|uniref:class I SAM-dependent methyltransferase n=1 Tax=Bacillus sp. AFS017336 TaxID=2033489 RepID=UPI000BEFF0B2|nr:class I SAM-dependent methyltransferase [Bacillus sp. AFS017336]PEL10702.1 SAM-dependent methyltransferase [Bacillus sp. AFS017336]
MKLIDPTTHMDWVAPHSIEWYKQLANLYGEYSYTWDSKLTEPNGETNFIEEVTQMIVNKRVLDVGCGHGEFTLICSSIAKEIVGFDVTEDFIKNGNKNKKQNVFFVVGNIKDGLPFESGEFDCAYNRKGPTTAYLELNRVVKNGGKILGLHPGDDLGSELPLLFPNLFESNSEGTPILDNLKEKLNLGRYAYFEIQIVKSIEFLHTPNDVFKLRCFGQKPIIYKSLIEENYSKVKQIFEQNVTKDGLPITFSRYIVRATV